MTAETLSSLNIKRGAIKRKLTLAQNALPDLSCLMEIQERLTKLRPIYDEFFEIQMQIEDIEISLNQTSTADQGTTFDKDYHSVLSKLRTLEAQHKPQSQQTTIANSNSNEVNQKSVPVKLPELTLPSFDGSYSDWTSFYDTFSALVDQNTQLSEIHKFHYLKSCLKGNAIKTIESLKVTAENYYIAWSLLQNRYSNQRLIVQEHIFGILNHNNLNKPSYQELRKLLDTVSSHLEALNVHDITPQKFRDVTLVAIISEKLDFVSKREWQSKLTTNLPTWDQLKEFLEKRCETLETLHLMSNKSVSHDNNSKKVNPKVVANVSTNKGKKSNSDNNKILTCPCCSQNHNLFHCAQFINLTVKDRINLVHSKHLCNNCFRNNHVASTCKSEYRCKMCKEPHNTLLHETLSQTNNNQQPPTVLKINSHQVYFSNVILPTAQVQVFDYFGKKHVFRALLDSGSQLNFVSERVAKLLKLKLQPVVLSVAGINQSLTNASNVTDIKIQSNYEDYNSNLSCVVIPQISEFLPCNSFSTANLKFPQHIQLADPTFHVKGAIDLLIGAQVFFQLLKPNRESLAQNFLLQETKLGWVVVNSCYNNGQDIAIRNLCHFVQPALEQMVNKFWELDSFKNETIINQDDALCEKIFADHHKRSKTGKYVVPLPFKQEKLNLGTSRAGAIKRFKSLECKFRRDKGFKTVYAKVIEDYFRQGHAEQVPANELDNPCYYLPHHGVTKEESTTTQLRVVFDASAKTSNQKSLNDLLLIGPKIDSDLYSILLRFREHKVAFTADISQMYRQIQIQPQYYDYQRFVWRFDEISEIQTYRLKTVTFGVSSAPYLAIRPLHQLASDERHNFPNAYDHITKNMYVDDLLSGSDNTENALKLKTEISECLARGTFSLRKWASNEKSLLPNSVVHTSEINLDKEGISKTLGIIWNCNSDHIQYRIKLRDVNVVKTKRVVLSLTAQLFDPLGLIAPVVVTAKIFLQKLWTAKLEWDEKLPNYLENQWDNFVKTLSDLNDVIIPRCVIGVQTPAQVELHGFCDSSQLAYGACIFVKSCDKNGDIQVRLLTAKSRVAPIKTQTLPRLELCGAVLVSELMTEVKKSLNCEIDNEFYYTDSTIVLSWLAASPNTWTTFVANRVSKIQTLTNIENWTHVPSNSNPADIISRGCTPKQLIDNKLWLNGPTFLWQNETDHSDNIKNIINPSETEERRRIVCTKAVINNESSELLLKYSSFKKLINVIALCFRFYNKIKGEKITGPLSVKEIRFSHNVIVKLVQQEAFPDEYNCLVKNKPLPKSSPLIKLNPFLDADSIIRVGGRLVNANIFYNKKFPIVIPKRHHITNLIVEREHLRRLHAGPQATLAAIRESYWLLGGRNTIRRILHNCVLCRRASPITYEEIMGNLPDARVNLIRPFRDCGVDYAGPISIREGKGRGKRSIKAYVCLFICLATKAIHLELVTDCTSSSFIGAFKRFMSRRGKPSRMYSDNATTFKGSDRELRFIHQEVIKSELFKNFISNCAENNVEWHFIPPRSPHVGGIWEAGIKSMKFHFKRIIGQSLFTYEEMYTCLTLIEACLNSRPITPLSSNPDDLSPLTPGHFLIGTALTAPAESDVTEINIHRLDQWQKIQQVRQHFWKRWSRGYIVELQQRSKWATSTRPAAVGDIVIVHEDNIPPLCWSLGRIEAVQPGRDGKVRTVSVRTKSGVVKRSVHKLSPLPV
jgi:hypothetical protein